MEVLDPVTYDLVVAEWSKQNTDRHSLIGATFNGEEAPVAWALEPDVANPDQNLVRSEILALLRPMVLALPVGTA